MKILILRVSAIGDVVHTLPAVFLLRKLYPKAEISWVAQKKAANIIRGLPFLKNIWELPNKYLKRTNWGKTYLIIKEMRQEQWDAILDFQGLTKTGIISLALNGKRFGFDKKYTNDLIASYINHYHITPNAINIIQKNLALADNLELRALGKKLGHLNLEYEHCSPVVSELKNELVFSKEIRDKVDQWYNENVGERFIAISPNTTWESKHWPLESWKKLLPLLDEHKVVLIGKSFGEYADILHAWAQTKIITAPEWDVFTTGYLLSKAKLVIGPDTGFVHFADLLDIPSIGIFGPTLAKQHGPFLSNQNIKNCVQIQCPHRYKKSHKGALCMHQLTPDKLFNKIESVLRG